MTDTFNKEYIPLTDAVKCRIDQIKQSADKLYDDIDWAVDADKRMIALAKTNLEQAVMWAVKAVTNPPVPKE